MFLAPQNSFTPKPVFSFAVRLTRPPPSKSAPGPSSSSANSASAGGSGAASLSHGTPVASGVTRAGTDTTSRLDVLVVHVCAHPEVGPAQLKLAAPGTVAPPRTPVSSLLIPLSVGALLPVPDWAQRRRERDHERRRLAEVEKMRQKVKQARESAAKGPTISANGTKDSNNNSSSSDRPGKSSTARGRLGLGLGLDDDEDGDADGANASASAATDVAGLVAELPASALHWYDSPGCGGDMFTDHLDCPSLAKFVRGKVEAARRALGQKKADGPTVIVIPSPSAGVSAAGVSTSAGVSASAGASAPAPAAAKEIRLVSGLRCDRERVVAMVRAATSAGKDGKDGKSGESEVDIKAALGLGKAAGSAAVGASSAKSSGIVVLDDGDDGSNSGASSAAATTTAAATTNTVYVTVSKHVVDVVFDPTLLRRALGPSVYDRLHPPDSGDPAAFNSANKASKAGRPSSSSTNSSNSSSNSSSSGSSFVAPAPGTAPDADPELVAALAALALQHVQEDEDVL